MKKILFMCCILVGFAAASYAQGGGRGRMSPEERAKQMQTNLKLTDDQTAKITAVLAMQAAKQDSIRTAANGDRQAMMSAMGPVRQMVETKMASILTTEQAAAYKKMMDEQRARMQQGGGTPPPPQK